MRPLERFLLGFLGDGLRGPAGEALRRELLGLEPAFLAALDDPEADAFFVTIRRAWRPTVMDRSASGSVAHFLWSEVVN